MPQPQRNARMKKLSEKEADHLHRLLRRAIANNQLNLHAASPYKNGQWKRDGWKFNDRHDGVAINTTDWNTSVMQMDDERGRPRSEVSIFIDQRSLDFLANGVQCTKN